MSFFHRFCFSDSFFFSSFLQRLDTEAKSLKKCAKLLYFGFQELVNTEEKYVNDMDVLITSIICPLQNNFNQEFSDSKIPKVSSKGINSIFGNLEQLVGVNRSFLFDLKNICVPTTRESTTTSNTADYPDHSDMERVWCEVASLIRQTWPFFRAYKTYSAGHGNRDMSLWYEKCKGLDDWITASLSSSSSSSSCSLEAELIKPIQRILKYSLFVRDALKSTRSLDSLGHLEDAMSAVDAISSEVNASLIQNERDQKMVNLWNKLGKQPENFLQPGRSLLEICVAEVAPAMNGDRGYTWGKRKEYLVCVLSDIILFARPNKAGLFGNSRVETTSVLAVTAGGATTEPTHHMKMLARMTDLDLTHTYAATQPRGDCGFELRVLGTIGSKDMEVGYSPYNAYAIWCQSTEAKDKLSKVIREALSSQLAAFFSRKKIKIPGSKSSESESVGGGQ